VTRHAEKHGQSSGKEGSTYKVANDQAVQELQRAHHYQERHKGVQQLNALRRLLEVVVPYALYNVLRAAAGFGV
jgi:hypothetical protein